MDVGEGMSKLSVIIPARNEQYLNRTVEDLFAKAAGEIEVIAVLDGPSEYLPPTERKGLTVIRKVQEGLRPAINAGADAATGKYLCKVDAHTAVSPGFDETLKADCDGDWVVVSRYCALNIKTWQPNDQPPVDAYYLCCPWTNPRVFQFIDTPWASRNRVNRDVMLDETMGMQASLWFMFARHYHDCLNGLDIGRWGTWSVEQQEIGLKTWLSGGKVVVNKNVWNAHYQRPHMERERLRQGYSKTRDAYTHRKAARYWLADKWEKQTRPFEWLVDHFWPLPTESNHTTAEKYWWPEDWRSYWNG